MKLLKMQFCPLSYYLLPVWYTDTVYRFVQLLYETTEMMLKQQKTLHEQVPPPTVYLPMTLWEKICPTTCNTVGCSRDMISGWSSITLSNVSIVFSKPIAVMAFSSEPSSVSRTWLNVAAFRNKEKTWNEWLKDPGWTGVDIKLPGTSVAMLSVNCSACKFHRNKQVFSLPLPKTLEHGPRTAVLKTNIFCLDCSKSK